MPVSVVDAIMGSGKTSNMMRYMESYPNNRYLYISPFKSEVGDGNTGMLGRLQERLPEMFPLESMPKNYGEGKASDLKGLLAGGGNIATTHALFSRFDNEIVDLALMMDYAIIIDEAVDCVQVYDKLTKKDVTALLESEWVLVDPESKLVRWNEAKNPEFDGRYSDVRDLANSECLYLFEGRILVSEYPPKLLRESKTCIIMTYLFEGSVMACWLKANGIPYEYVDIKRFHLSAPQQIKEMIRKNLVVLGSRKLDNKYNKPEHDMYRYSATWYKDRATVAEKVEIRKAMESCVANNREPGSMVVWTTFLGSEDRLAGKGFKKGFINPDTGEELDSFLAFNTKAINDYMHHDIVMYTVNLFRSPIEKRYLESKGVEFNEDLWALSEMLQFIWRSRIRQGLPTKVLVLSKRMRLLLMNWLKEDY